MAIGVSVGTANNRDAKAVYASTGSYTLTFDANSKNDGTGTSCTADGSTALTSENIFSYADYSFTASKVKYYWLVDGYSNVASVSSVANCYPGKNSTMKVGKSAGDGTISFTVSGDSNLSIDSIEITAFGSGNTAKITIDEATAQTKEWTLSTSSGSHTFTYASAVKTVTLTGGAGLASSNKIAYISQMVINYTVAGGESLPYTVCFDANGGSGSMSDVPVAAGNYTLPANGFTPPSGKAFSGWKAGNAGELIEAGSSYNVTDDVTFYAQWEDIKYTVTYNANGGTGEITDSSSPYSSGATVTVLNNSFTRDGYNFVCFNTQANGSGTDYNPSDTFTVTANTTLYAKWIYPYTDSNNKITWDLSKVSYNSMTDDSALWQSTKATVSIDKNSASIATNNYCPPAYSSTRLYSNSTLTISPSSGYKINSIVFTATTNDYATTLAGSTWTNATASSNNTKVTVTPTLRMNNVIATIGGTTGINKIEINYSTYSALSSIALSGTYQTSFNQGEAFSHDGMVVTATYANSSTADVSSSATWSGYNTSTLGEQTVTVTYSEDGVTKTATYSITVSVAHYIIPTDDSTSGQVGNSDTLLYTYGNLSGTINIVSDNTSVVTIGDNVYENGTGLVEINFVGSGTANVIFKEDSTQMSSVTVTVTRTTNTMSSTLFTASMTGEPSVTSGYEIDTENTEKKSGYHQDKGTANSSICYFVVTKDSSLFAREPAQIKLDARLCGGQSKDPLTYNVEACFVDSEGNDIESTKVTVTTGVTTSSTHYIVEMPYSVDAYGVKLYHKKADGHNIRYYSFELTYSISDSVKTICGTENKTGEVTTSVSSVVLRFGAKLSDENWTAFNSEHTIEDYGVMFARKTYLDSHSVSSVKAAYETNESLLYVVRRGSGTTPSLSEGNRVFTAYLNIDSSDYATVFCATPFIVAGGQYYFLDEMRYSVKTLAAECQTTHASPLSDEALAILNA